MTPQRIGRYEILSEVGRGANGIVYRAQDPTIRRVVALKVLPAEPTGAGDTQGRSQQGVFEREAQAAGALLHPNIVTLYDAGLDSNCYYLAMEFIEGGTFAAEIAERKHVPAERVAEIGAVVADALDFAHERGVVHRDIKPANLMILPDQSVKVADFGIARLAGTSSSMTAGMIVGTPRYMSPEQVKGDNIDGRSDLFSLGVVLWEALTGSAPFKAETLPGILHAIVSSTPPPPHQVQPDVPPELSVIVMRAMARARAERYGRGHELAADLRRFLDTRGETKAAAPAPRSRWPLAAGAAAGVAALAAYVLVGRQPLESPSPVPVQPGWVKFVSEPAGAEIIVDGKPVGRTPYTVEVGEGNHEVEYQKDGYYPGQTTIIVKPNETTEVPLSMVARSAGP